MVLAAKTGDRCGECERERNRAPPSAASYQRERTS